MRINKLHINVSKMREWNMYKGLKDIKIDGMSNVVTLVGKNGSGKSRILELIPVYISRMNIGQIFDDTFEKMPSFISDKLEVNEIIKKYISCHFQYQSIYNENQINSTDKLKDQLNELQTRMATLYNNMAQEERNTIGNLDQIQNQMPGLVKNLVKYIDNDLISALSDRTGVNTLDTIIEDHEELQSYDETTILKESALSFLRRLGNLVAYSYLRYKNPDEYEKQIPVKRFESFSQIVKNFLNKDLTYDLDESQLTVNENEINNVRGKLKLNGMDFNFNILSPGERTLFAYCMYFYILEQNPYSRIKDSIIVIDEPEKHLHPEIQIKLIDGIRKMIGETGQLWIATHSVNILSHLYLDEIYLVKDGQLYYPKSSTPTESLMELMGLEEHVERLYSFVGDVSSWEYVNFITQCYLNPDVLSSSRKNDSEVEVFKKSIKDSERICLLDYGAGKGRLFKEIRNDKILSNKIDYQAVEIKEEYIKELVELGVSKIYKENELLPINQYDHVLLCNVLHEIPVEKWGKVFNKITSTLKEDGYLILIEDLQIPKGENPNENGFLILDLPELKELFDMKKNPSSIQTSNEKKKDRILCAIIRKSEIGKVDAFSIRKALQSLELNSLKKIRELRRTKFGDKYEQGRKTAMYSQLHINSELQLDGLEDEDNEKYSGDP